MSQGKSSTNMETGAHGPELWPPQRILIADDDAHIRQLLIFALSSEGYQVHGVTDGRELVRQAHQYAPHLMLVDLNMPLMDGYQAIKAMRNDSRVSHIPMLILTARIQTNDMITGFDIGADDYIVKPFDINEVLARVRSHLRQAARRSHINPLSGLPSGMLIQHELHIRFEQGAPLVLLHIDIDNFKTFNDTYGLAAGDRAIMLVVKHIQQALVRYGTGNDFIGHVGGDDFVMLTTPEAAESICLHIIDGFGRDIHTLYDQAVLERGYVSGVDRFGLLRRFPLISLSIGGASNINRSFTTSNEFVRVAAEMKNYAKDQHGGMFAIDQRNTVVVQTTERRQSRVRRVVVASSDTSLARILEDVLARAHYAVYQAANPAELQRILDEQQPVCVISDLPATCDLVATFQSAPLCVLLATAEQATPQPTANRFILHMPLLLTDIVTFLDTKLAHTR